MKSLFLLLMFASTAIAAPPVAPKESDYPEVSRKRTVKRTIERTVEIVRGRKVRRRLFQRKQRVRRLFKRKCRRCG